MLCFRIELYFNRVRAWALTVRPWIGFPYHTMMEIPKFPTSWSYYSVFFTLKNYIWFYLTNILGKNSGCSSAWWFQCKVDAPSRPCKLFINLTWNFWKVETQPCLQETEINQNLPHFKKSGHLYYSHFHHLLHIREDTTSESSLCIFLGKCNHLR